MGNRFARLRASSARFQEKYALEIRRQTVHAIGLLVLIPLLLLPETHTIKLLGALVLLTMLGNWFVTSRKPREKHFRQLVQGLGLPKRLAENQAIGEEAAWTILKNFVRRNENEPLQASFFALFSAFMAAVLFGIPFAIFGILALGIGDAFSTIIGKKWGHNKLIYNKEKSLEGSMAFFFTTFVAALCVLNFFPQLAILNSTVMAFMIALSGAFIETIPTVNDNLSIPIGVGFVIWLLTLL